jgi:hypothetical protein
MSMTLAHRSARGGAALGLAGLLALSLLPLAPRQAAPSTPASGTTQDNRSSDAQQAALAKAAEALLDRLWHLPRRAAQGGVTVCSAAEVDLGGDGQLELVASVDYSGRRFCNTLAVVGKGSSRAPQVTDTWEMDDVRESIKRNADGSLMLVVPTALTDYEGVECMAVWLRLFRFQNGALVDVSTAYPDFYKARKQQVDATIAKMNREKADTGCALIESDKLDRFLGASPTAGYKRAVTWMRSVDPAMRKRAARVFADIGDAVSLAKLKDLARDADPAVVASAQGGMEEARNRRR